MRFSFLASLLLCLPGCQYFQFTGEDRVTELRVEASDYRYEEPALMEMEGREPQLRVGTTYTEYMRNHFVAEAGLEGGYGRYDYGSNGTGQSRNHDQYFFKVEGHAGYRQPVFSGSEITFYTGLGYRILYDDGGGSRTTTGHYGYDRRSQYLYLPIGIRYFQPLSNSWALQPTLQANILMRGKQTSYLSDIDPQSSDIPNDQKRGFGFNADLMLTQYDPMDHCWPACKYNSFKPHGWAFGPFFRYWEVKDSKQTQAQVIGTPIVVTFIEPENRAWEYGVRAAYRF